MRADDLRARVRRFEDLSLGLARELAYWTKALHPLLWEERNVYTDALAKAIAGVDEARIALAGAMHRVEDESRE